MLASLRKRRRAVASEGDGGLLVDEAERIAAIIFDARSRLRPFAERTSNKDIYKMHRYLGAFDGVGALLQLASVDARDTRNFRAEAGALIEKFENAALNYTVVFSLLITITVSLAVLHSGTGAYQLAPETQSRLFSGVSQIESLAWADAATFIANRTSPPAQAAGQAHLMRAVFYALEQFFLAAGVTFTCVGLFKAVALCIAFGTALPSVVARCEHLLANHRRLYPMYAMMQQGGVACAMYAVVFIVARSSAIAFFFHCTFLLLSHYFFLNDQFGGGQLASLIWQQHREARRLFAGSTSSASGETACEPVSVNA